MRIFTHTFTICLLLTMGTTAYAASITMTFADAATGEPLSHVVVSLKLKSGQPQVQAMPLQVMDQIGKKFMPHVLPVTVGTPVSFPNSDDIRHHLYSFDEPKSFELPLYEGTPTNPIVFDKKGIVRLGCNIHDWMMGYIYIVDTPWFALSDPSGQLHIKDISSGEHEIVVWHPRIKSRKVKVSELVLKTSEHKVSVETLDVRKVRKMKKRLRSRRDGY